jgi:hypothetical protein
LITYQKDSWHYNHEKYVDANHFALMRKLAKDLTIVLAKAPLDR